MPHLGPTDRVVWVDIAKAIAITLVAVHHAIIFAFASGWLPVAAVSLDNQLVTFRMPLFFLAAGLFAASALSKPWSIVMRRRVLFYGYLYVLWNTLRFVWFQGVPDVRGDTDGATVVDLLRSMVLPDTGLWFLFALAIFTLVAKVARPVPVVVQLVAAASISLLSASEMFPVENFAWRNMASYFVFFLVGMYGSARIRLFANTVTPGRALIAGGVALMLTAGGQLADLVDLPGLRLLTSFSMVTFGICVAVLMSRVRLARTAAGIGASTLPIYLIHVFVISGIVVLIDFIWQPPPTIGVALVVLIVVVSMGVSLAFHRAAAGGMPWLFSLPRTTARKSSHQPDPHPR